MGIWFLSLLINSGCNRDLVEYDSNDLKISIEKGEEWLHNFPLFLGINIKNPPQIAIWTEDMEGNYRKEALPHWCYQRGIQYEDGLYLPSKKEPLTDGISGATPKGSFNVKMSPTGKLKKFIVKIEINHSTDFNDAYPKSAKEGDANYSGGKEGSGQPALVYAAEVDLTSGKKEFTAKLIGHSSPDGSNGDLTKDTSSLTTALHIVKSITVYVQ